MKKILIGLALILSLSCTKKKESSNISIDLSQIISQKLSLSIDSIDVLILNITGPGIAPIYVEADCRNGCSQITAKVAAGQSRLIQMLMVADTTEGVSKIFYGDRLMSLGGGDLSLVLPIKEKASFTNEADWSGRYIPKAGHPLSGKYLTGRVDVRVYPGDGKPDMKVTQFDIYGGWFHAFLLDTVNFKFVFTGYDENGSSIGPSSVFNDLHSGAGLRSTSSSLLPALGRAIVHMESSAPLYEERNGSYEDETLSKQIIGFFGENPDGKTLCSQNQDPLLDFNFDGGGTTSGPNRTRLCKVSGSSCGGSNFASWTDITVTGAFPYCASPSANDWPLDQRFLDQKVDFVGFYGPFSRNITAGQTKMFESLTAPPRMGWYLDPQSNVGFVEVFSRIEMTPFDEDLVRLDHDEGIDCSQLENFGFVSRNLVAKGVDTYQFLAGEIAASVDPSYDFRFAFCPVKPSGGYYSSAVLSPNFNDSSGGGSSSPPTQLALERLHNLSSITINYSACNPFKVELQDSDAIPTHVDIPINVDLTHDLVTANYYSDPECSVVITDINLSGSEIVFFEQAGGSGFNRTLTVSDPAAMNPLSPATYGVFTDNNSSSITSFFPAYDRAQVLEQAHTETCVEYIVARTDGAGALARVLAAGSEETVKFTPSGSQGIFANSADCEGNINALALNTSITLTADETLHSFWVRDISGTPGTINNLISACTGAGSGCPAAPPISIVNPGAYDHFHDGVSNVNPSTGTCVPVLFEAFDNRQPKHYPVFWPGGNMMNLDTDGGLTVNWHYNSGECSGDTNAIVGPPFNQALLGSEISEEVWFKVTSLSGSTGDLIFTHTNGEERRVSITVP